MEALWYYIEQTPPLPQSFSILRLWIVFINPGSHAVWSWPHDSIHVCRIYFGTFDGDIEKEFNFPFPSKIRKGSYVKLELIMSKHNSGGPMINDMNLACGLSYRVI